MQVRARRLGNARLRLLVVSPELSHRRNSHERSRAIKSSLKLEQQDQLSFQHVETIFFFFELTIFVSTQLSEPTPKYPSTFIPIPSFLNQTAPRTRGVQTARATRKKPKRIRQKYKSTGGSKQCRGWCAGLQLHAPDHCRMEYVEA
jgi:hypothetical protein